MADDFLALTPVDPISMAMPGRQTLAAALDAGITARDVRNAINQTAIRVTALEGAPAGGVNAVDDQQILHPGAADFDFLFPGAPASEPTQAEFYCETAGVYGNVYVKVIGDVVYGEFATVNFGRPCSVTGGIERINGGLRFKGGAVWSIGGGVAEVDPFAGFTLTIAASF